MARRPSISGTTPCIRSMAYLYLPIVVLGTLALIVVPSGMAYLPAHMLTERIISKRLSMWR